MTSRYLPLLRARGYLMAAAAGLSLLSAACAAQQPTPQPTAAPAAKLTQAPAAAASPASAQPATASPPVTAASPAAASPSPATSPVAAGGTRLVLAGDGNRARFRAQEQLTGRPMPNEAIGESPAVRGTIVLEPGGSINQDASKVVVDLRELKSDSDRRDNFIKRNTLETERFPTAELVPTAVQGLSWPLPTSGEASFQLLGNLTVHGVTRPTVWEVEAQFSERTITGTASTEVKMTDFGMTPPTVGPVLSLEDELTLEIDFRVNQESGVAASAGGGPVTGVGSVKSVAPVAVVQSAEVPADCEPTRPDALGPFYVPGAPLRESIGSGHLLSGVVRAAGSCEPIAGAQIELWQVNPQGQYDDDHRATIIAGPTGEYRFESNPPPAYAGRPPHIHLRITAPGFQTLVTQYYPQPGQTEAVFDLVLTP